MHRTRWLTWLLPLTLLPSTACIVRVVDDGDDEVGEVGETADSSDATSETTDTSDATSDSTGDGSDSSDSTGDTDSTDDTSDTSDTTTDTGNDQCPPLPESPASFGYQLDIPGVDSWDADITWTCELLDFNTLDGLTLTLDCPEAIGPVSLAVLADPLLVPPLQLGASITLRYVSEGPWWFNTYLRVDMDGFGHVFTLIDGDSLVPPDPYVFELPFPISTVSGVCEPTPAGCGDRERLGLAFELGGEAIVMFDPEYAIVGGDPGTDVWVAQAGHLHDILCSDTPDEWFKVLIANTGWE